MAEEKMNTLVLVGHNGEVKKIMKLSDEQLATLGAIGKRLDVLLDKDAEDATHGD